MSGIRQRGVRAPQVFGLLFGLLIVLAIVVAQQAEEEVPKVEEGFSGTISEGQTFELKGVRYTAVGAVQIENGELSSGEISPIGNEIVIAGVKSKVVGGTATISGGQIISLDGVSEFSGELRPGAKLNGVSVDGQQVGFKNGRYALTGDGHIAGLAVRDVRDVQALDSRIVGIAATDATTVHAIQFRKEAKFDCSAEPKRCIVNVGQATLPEGITNIELAVEPAVAQATLPDGLVMTGGVVQTDTQGNLILQEDGRAIINGIMIHTVQPSSLCYNGGCDESMSYIDFCHVQTVDGSCVLKVKGALELINGENYFVNDGTRYYYKPGPLLDTKLYAIPTNNENKPIMLDELGNPIWIRINERIELEGGSAGCYGGGGSAIGGATKFFIGRAFGWITGRQVGEVCKVHYTSKTAGGVEVVALDSPVEDFATLHAVASISAEHDCIERGGEACWVYDKDGKHVPGIYYDATRSKLFHITRKWNQYTLEWEVVRENAPFTTFVLTKKEPQPVAPAEPQPVAPAEPQPLAPALQETTPAPGVPTNCIPKGLECYLTMGRRICYKGEEVITYAVNAPYCP